ncbi:Deoxyguanosinetriphosphate triphosphohydrolase [Bacteroides pyogenes]|uniref:deoxyguanosinetriphosphate triphosphohydrolase n=1 Tax=Bacteroides pyogenes TaxID=310300 RepID=UPI001BAADED7|nr:deoxyguanosinetriphosphate triphosphohydrolase [Bacteroides pyogenes]MBR8706031.1 Deoxyguanosinetriphosphate triphosphohydrolase [Bacteroides pyogenes]MBR8719010.1 Deoxyguanosinetriphosphate triphosphohydrolase [Bacteroides pyogenes]MBR8723816.1 Deoxyguanosinetriphosphate triphosphohydrolase [Bacteroides pyogenes]MBR8737317.1 Deoxyguanosinetriphosphate triphosphohydrolase [Bacteroides pyogenes]MBR8752940.1 Deoxyguanosinetriphosphate triphosphohydrolase [Bacteroides pyogenes]
MNWKQLISARRFGMEEFHREREENRSEFQRDYDRLIFSAPFRRLQNKTQVFPLPGSVFVHNRLTHSLEVSCVGRSLGNDVAKAILKRQPELRDSYLPEIGSIVSAACLAHDLGNPPFGHSGERAISTFFSEGKGQFLQEKQPDGQQLSAAEWEDLIHFEGNANAFRLLTHRFEGRRKGGFAMTYTTLASIVKYPFSSSLAGKKSKFGFFTTEEESYRKIATELGLTLLNEHPLRYARHPLVFLVEAADDICYQMMDIEDAHKLKILTTEETKQLFMGFFEDERIEHIRETLRIVSDTNEQIAYLRSSVIGLLIRECTRVFLEHEPEILAGTFEGALIRHIAGKPAEAYEHCAKVSMDKIYRSRDVLDIELAGFRIISTLLELMIDAVTSPEKAYSKLLINRVSGQYHINSPVLYERIQAVLDYISGMTDVFALDLYRKINGNSLPAV